MMKRSLGMAVALAVALLAGWIWGGWGRSDAAGALQAADLRAELLAARAAALDARIAIYNVNFGEASQHLEDARSLLDRADARLKDLGRDESAAQLQAALGHLDEAQRLAGKLDQAANTRAGDAARIIAELLERADPRAR